MAVLGPRALIDLALPTGIDAGELMRFQMQEGMTAAEVIGLAATVIGEVNVAIEQRWGGLFYITEQMTAQYRQKTGSARKTPTNSEFTTADPVRGGRIGHMLPREDYTDTIAWSEEFLRRASRELIRLDIDEISDSWYNRLDSQIIERALTTTEQLIGSAGYSPGWAIGTGMNLNYIPPQYRAYTFDSTHTHFIKTNAAISTTNTISTLILMAAQLSHHGFSGRKVAIVAEVDAAYYTGMTGFIAIIPAEFRAITGGSAALTLATGEVEGIPGETLGYVMTPSGIVEIRAHERIPTGYLWMTKSFGVNNPRNGLAIWTENGVGFGLRPDPQVSRSIMPKLEAVFFKATHGVGVGDRLNGVAAQITTGGTTYVNPTIS